MKTKVILGLTLLLAVLALAGVVTLYLEQQADVRATTARIEALDTGLNSSGDQGKQVGGDITALKEEVSALEEEASALEGRLSTASRKNMKALETEIELMRGCFTEVARQVQNGFEVQYRYASPSSGLSTPCESYINPQGQSSEGG